MTIGRNVEDDIKSALSGGKKRPTELAELTSRHETNIYPKLTKLQEKGEIGKEDGKGSAVYYYLIDEQGREIDCPSVANTEDVRDVLTDIHNEVVSSNTKLTGRSLREYMDKVADSNQHSSDQSSEIVEQLSEFDRIVSHHSFVLDDDESEDLFFSILDELMPPYGARSGPKIRKLVPRDRLNPESDQHPVSYVRANERTNPFHDHLDVVCRVPETVVNLFFHTAIGINHNWQQGYESDSTRKRLVSKCEDVLSESHRINPDHAETLHLMVASVDPQSGKELFKRMVRSGNYENDILEEIASTSYADYHDIETVFNEIDPSPHSRIEKFTGLLTRLKQRFLRNKLPERRSGE